MHLEPRSRGPHMYLSSFSFCQSLVGWQNAKQLPAGTLLRFTIGGGGLHMVEGQSLSADLQYQGMSHQRRGVADSCTKVREWEGG